MVVLQDLWIQVLVVYLVLLVLMSFIKRSMPLVLEKLASSQDFDVGRKRVYGIINKVYSILYFLDGRC